MGLDEVMRTNTWINEVSAFVRRGRDTKQVHTEKRPGEAPQARREASGGTNPANMLISDFWLTNLSEYISVILSYPVMVICYRGPKELLIT